MSWQHIAAAQRCAFTDALLSLDSRSTRKGKLELTAPRGIRSQPDRIQL